MPRGSSAASVRAFLYHEHQRLVGQRQNPLHDQLPRRVGFDQRGGRNSTSFTTESAREAARASARVRREKRLQREASAQDKAPTFRQRLGVSLSKLSQPELDQVVSGLAHRGNANALARLADQAFGRPLPAEEDAPGDEELASLTREERAVLRQMLEEGFGV